MTIGVGVEGPSDRAFWQKVLVTYFPRVRFDIRNMQNKTRLIRQAPLLVESFRGAHYAATYLIVDADEAPCVSQKCSTCSTQASFTKYANHSLTERSSSVLRSRNSRRGSLPMIKLSTVCSPKRRTRLLKIPARSTHSAS